MADQVAVRIVTAGLALDSDAVHTELEDPEHVVNAAAVVDHKGAVHQVEDCVAGRMAAARVGGADMTGLIQMTVWGTLSVGVVGLEEVQAGYFVVEVCCPLQVRRRE